MRNPHRKHLTFRDFSRERLLNLNILKTFQGALKAPVPCGYFLKLETQASPSISPVTSSISLLLHSQSKSDKVNGKRVANVSGMLIDCTHFIATVASVQHFTTYQTFGFLRLHSFLCTKFKWCITAFCTAMVHFVFWTSCTVNDSKLKSLSEHEQEVGHTATVATHRQILSTSLLPPTLYPAILSYYPSCPSPPNGIQVPVTIGFHCAAALGFCHFTPVCLCFSKKKRRSYFPFCLPLTADIQWTHMSPFFHFSSQVFLFSHLYPVQSEPAWISSMSWQSHR